jgi:4-hydroxyphenylpyruvate dioxygenase
MRRSIATVSLSGTLRRRLEAIAAAGFDGVELFEPDLIAFRDPPEALRSLCADLGLAIELYQPFRDFEGWPDEAMARVLDRAERKFDLMQRLGAPLMLVCSNVSAQSLPEVERAAAQLRQLADRAAARGLRVGYEALSWGRHVRRWRDAWARVALADHPALGLVLDSFHTLALDDPFDSIADLPGERIFFVQMADAPRMRLDVIDWARHHRSFPGQGQLDVSGFFARAWAAGYRGLLSLEVFNDVFRETPNRRIAVDAMRSLLWLESQVRLRVAPPAEPSPDRALFAPPALPGLDGWSFVELEADEAAAAELGALLQRMGFEPPRRHRTKPVSLYRQGSIRLVVNRGSHAHARDRIASRGPGIGAVALRCADASAARDRAVQFRSARFDPPTGPGEIPLPSVVAPGGTVLHFVDSTLGDDGLFDNDFECAPAGDGTPAAPGAGLTAIDHLAVSVAGDRVDTWVLFCRAVLGLEPGDSQKLADPNGLLRSFGMSDRMGRLRLLLSVPQSARTAMSRAVVAAGGAVVQSIALRSDDVFASVAAARAAGVAFVPVPANYHDDLAARMDLPAGWLERMRALGVMFDRDAGGDWLHACTWPTVGGIAFEIVQRVGGYAGFGVVNAPVRLAVQADLEPDAA